MKLSQLLKRKAKIQQAQGLLRRAYSAQSKAGEDLNLEVVVWICQELIDEGD